MKKKRKKKAKVSKLHLICKECDNRFITERYRKYCTVKCRKAANAKFQKVRYAELREIVLKAKGVI